MKDTTIHTEGGAVAATADTLVAAPTKARRPTSAYDDPTPEKIAFGKRMKEAREIAGMSQREAAKAMGYGQQVQLHLMESGQRMPPARMLIHCAMLYGTTMDYLCGLADDSDCDPAVAAQREVAVRVVADVRRLIGTITDGATDAVRQLRPDAGRTARLAVQVVEVAATLDRVRQLGGESFADLPAGALLARRVQETLATANEHLTAVARAQRVAGVAPVDVLHLAGVDLPSDAADLAKLAGRLTRPLQVAAGDGDDAHDDELAPMTDTKEDAQPCPHNAA